MLTPEQRLAIANATDDYLYSLIAREIPQEDAAAIEVEFQKILSALRWRF